MVFLCKGSCTMNNVITVDLKLPGHGREFVESPIQLRPRADGAGFVQLRCRWERPLATELLHADQLLQAAQPPFTAK